jgi:hypothetical protein
MSGREYSAAAKKPIAVQSSAERNKRRRWQHFSLKKMEKRFGTPLEGVESAARRFDISTLFY